MINTSDPGNHSVLYPCILLNLINISCIVSSNACPICNFPVTFGGGIIMQYVSCPLFSEKKKIIGINPKEKFKCKYKIKFYE